MPTASGHTTPIRASRVLGTEVHNAAGEKLGHVEDVILDKSSDRIMFAVIGLDRAMTATDNFFPVPWSALDYQEDKGGYVVPYSRDDLARFAPAASVGDLTEDDATDVVRALDKG